MVQREREGYASICCGAVKRDFTSSKASPSLMQRCLTDTGLPAECLHLCYSPIMRVSVCLTVCLFGSV